MELVAVGQWELESGNKFIPGQNQPAGTVSEFSYKFVQNKTRNNYQGVQHVHMMEQVCNAQKQK